MECTVSWTGGVGTRSGMGFVAETGTTAQRAPLWRGSPAAK